MIEGKKISQLDTAVKIGDSFFFPVLSKGGTKKISFSILLNTITNKLSNANQDEIEKIKETVQKLEKQLQTIGLDQQEVEKLLKDIDFTINGQNETILDYTAKVKEFERALVSNSVAESIMNISKLIPEKASETNKLADREFVSNSVAEVDEFLNDRIDRLKDYTLIRDVIDPGMNIDTLTKGGLYRCSGAQPGTFPPECDSHYGTLFVMHGANNNIWFTQIFSTDADDNNAPEGMWFRKCEDFANLGEWHRIATKDTFNTYQTYVENYPLNSPIGDTVVTDCIMVVNFSKPNNGGTLFIEVNGLRRYRYPNYNGAVGVSTQIKLFKGDRFKIYSDVTEFMINSVDFYF